MSGSRVVPVITTALSSRSEDSLSTANTIDDIVRFCCPPSFTSGIKILLKEVHATELKRQNVKTAIEHFEIHLTSGTFPPQISGALKIPKIQFSTIFSNSGEHQSGSVWVERAINECRVSVLSHFVEQKKSELEVFNKQQSVEVLTTKTTEVIEATLTALDYDKPDSIPAYLNAEKRELVKIGYQMCEKALTLARHEKMDETARKKRKLHHKVDTDVTMAEAGPSDIAKTIREEVERAFKKAQSKNMKQPTVAKSRKGPKPKPQSQKVKKDYRGKGKGNGKKKPTRK
uniref:Bgt-20309 n=1 Tax=Blumeria graminis f. sp. tritici 96224 TaxID=1268274 RepID=A0A381L139_BLUGR